MSVYKIVLYLIITASLQSQLKCSKPIIIKDDSTSSKSDESFIFQSADKKLQIKIDWNVSHCDLLSLFENKTTNLSCNLEIEKPQFFISYRLLEDKIIRSFRMLDFENSTFSILNLTNTHFHEISLFEWNPFNDHVEYNPTYCSDSSILKSECFNQFSNKIEILLRIIQENSIEVYYRNESFKYDIIDRDLLIFTRNEDHLEYVNSYVTIQLSNMTIINLNMINGSAAFYCPELAGQELTAYFNAQWKANFHYLTNLNETIGVELNLGIFSLQPIHRRPQYFVVYETNMVVDSIKTLSNPFIINIPFKNRITKVSKVNTATLKIEWTRPYGTFDSINLVCNNGSYNIIKSYPKEYISGFCSYFPSISGQNIVISIYLLKNGIEYKSTETQKLIEPDFVKSFRLKNANVSSLSFAWQPPDGLFSLIKIACIESSTNLITYEVTVSNTTYNGQCLNLKSNTVYRVEVTTILVGDISILSSKSEYHFSTQPLVLNQLPLNQLSNVNFSDYDSNDIVNLINTLQSNFTNLRNQSISDNKLVIYINETAKVLDNIASRNTLSEKIDFILSFVKLIDDFLLESDDIFQENVYCSNKLSNSLQVISNKFELIQDINSTFEQEFMHFFIRTRLLSGSKLEYSDLGFAATFIDKESVFNINENSNDYFFNLDGFKYAAFFNKKPIEDLLKKNKTPRITYIGYSSSKLFSGTAKNLDYFEIDCKSMIQIAPNVISASEIKDVEPTEDLIYLIYEQNRNEKYCDRRRINYTYQCVYWDYGLNDWNNQGCNHIMIIKDDKILHKCYCNHTTNFALLMVADDLGFCEWCDTVLFYVSLIGVSLSIFGLLVTIFYDIIVTVLPASENQKYVGIMERYSSMSKEYLKVISTWCLTLLIMNSTYIAFSLFKFEDVEINDSKRASCIAIGVILHYFLLSSFCFSFCITLIQFLIVYKSFKIFRFIFLKSSIMSFSIPAIIVAIVIGIDRAAYINPNKYCWLHSWFAIFGAMVPIGIILIINLCIFLMIAISHSNLLKTRNKYLQQKEKIDEKGIKKEFILIFSCFVNTGLTWLFGFLVTIPGKDGWAYARFVYGLIFCLLNSTQGFQIFFTYFIISKRRRSILHQKIRFQLEEIKSKMSRHRKKKP